MQTEKLKKSYHYEWIKYQLVFHYQIFCQKWFRITKYLVKGVGCTTRRPGVAVPEAVYLEGITKLYVIERNLILTINE